jgi:uncharacterized protein (TIGR01777 family)
MDSTTNQSRQKVIIAGGTGFLGQLLARSLSADQYEVVLLSRGEPGSSVEIVGRLVKWDAHSIAGWMRELEGAKALINLTGRSIDCRHNQTNRKEILESRIQSTRVLGQAVAASEVPPESWLNASSMALYGQCFGDQPAHDEDSPTQSGGFLEEVTKAWEDEFFRHKREGVRQVALRISFILGRESGAFPLLAHLARFGLGGKQGSGEQWMSWLHEDDWVGITRYLIEEKQLEGPVNLAAPNPVKNRDFMAELSSHVSPFGFGLPAPAFGVRLGCILIGSAPELALQSRKVVSRVLESQNYTFVSAEILGAVKSLLNRE